MVDESDKGDSIHKVDTVPPPEGDGDAYNAATKVGPVSQDAWAELIRKANEEGERNAAASGPSSRPFGPPSSSKPVPSSGRPAPVSTKPASQPAIAPQEQEPLPRVYDEADEEDAATKLNDSARDRHGLAVPPSMQPALAPPPPVPARAPVIEHVAGPSVAPAPVAPASLPPAIATASVPPTSQRLVRPLAFQPGDPAMPPPVAEPPSLLDGRTLVITAVICVIVFLAGVGVFVFAR